MIGFTAAGTCVGHCVDWHSTCILGNHVFFGTRRFCDRWDASGARSHWALCSPNRNAFAHTLRLSLGAHTDWVVLICAIAVSGGVWFVRGARAFFLVILRALAGSLDNFAFLLA